MANTTENNFDDQICPNILRSKVSERKEQEREKYDTLVNQSYSTLDRIFHFKKKIKKEWTFSDAH